MKYVAGMPVPRMYCSISALESKCNTLVKTPLVTEEWLMVNLLEKCTSLTFGNIHQATPYEVLNSGFFCGISHSFTLFHLDFRAVTFPIVGYCKDRICSFQSILQSRGVVEVGLG